MGKTKANKRRALNLLKVKTNFIEAEVDDSLDCKHCSFSAVSTIELKKHQNECGKDISVVEINADADADIIEEMYACDVCQQCFKCESSLLKHKQWHEPPGGFKCTICDACFTTHDQRALHKQTMHKTFKCMICDEKILSEKLFLEHINKMHDGKDREYNICKDCGAHFQQKHQLKNHRETKCGTIKSFECHICNSKFVRQCTLNAHLMIHTGKKEFLCNYCGSSFLSKGQLQTHERSHTKEKPYFCTVCGKSFAHRESLVTHSSVHTGIKPFQCQCCGNQFSCIGNLIKHRRTRPETCGLPKYTNVKLFPRPSTKRVKPNKKRNARNETSEILSVEVWNGKNEDDAGIYMDSSSQMNTINIDSIVLKNETHNMNTQSDQVLYESSQQQIFYVSTDVTSTPTANAINITTPQTTDQLIIVDPIMQSGWQQSSNESENIDIVYTAMKDSSIFSNETDNDYNQMNTNQQSYEMNVQQDPMLNQVNQNNEQQVESEEYFECDICSKRFNQKKSLSMHFAMRHRERSQLACQYCDKTYTSQKLLDKHIVYHGLNGELVHKCPCCKLQFATKDEMQTHAQMEHEDRLKCTICNKFYKDLDCIAAHMRTMHRQAPKKKKYTYICSKCGRKFNSRMALGDHELGDCGRSPIYKCEHCGKALHSQGSWKTHQLIHTGDLPFQCKFCQKRFRTQGQVKIHSRCHSGEKPFKCQQCPKSFAHRESLMTHMSLHTGLKRFMCQCCSSRFSCISNLQAHRRTHKDTCGQLPLMTKAQYGLNLDNGSVVMTEHK